MRKRVDPGGVHRESDGFWSKVLVVTIVVIWVSLVAGQWAARWAIENGKFSGHHTLASTGSHSEQRPDYVRPPVHQSTVVPTPEDTPAEAASPQPTAVAPRATITVAPETRATSEPSTSASSDATSALQTPVLPPSDSPSPDDGNKTYSLQMGVFANQANADRLAQDLRSKGYSVDVGHNEGEGNYVVRVGHFATRADAEAESAKMQAQGFHPIPTDR